VILQTRYIEEQDSLIEFCQALTTADYLVIDTEFVRTRTLVPKLGLIQLCDGQQVGLIDPLAVRDLTPVWQLLSDGAITKYIHACSEDLEVFLTAGNCRPCNLLDTQIVMSFLGHGLSMGYGAMVKYFSGVELDKSESRTDWLKRPLSSKQLDYAVADVFYLHQLVKPLLEQAVDSGWLEAARSETQALIDKKFTPVNPENLYKEMKLAWRLNEAQLMRLKLLCQWRYLQAVKRDLPLSFIAKDHTLLTLAERNPKSVGAMASYEGIEVLDVRHQGKALLNVLKQASQICPQMYPAKISRLDDYPGYKQIFKTVKQFINAQAEVAGAPVLLCASKKHINQFLSYFWQINEGHQRQPELLSGWRGELFGASLLKFARQGFVKTSTDI
jgi:ribonuclease D